MRMSLKKSLWITSALILPVVYGVLWCLVFKLGFNPSGFDAQTFFLCLLVAALTFVGAIVGIVGGVLSATNRMGRS